jgi:hypothetical protein
MTPLQVTKAFIERINAHDVEGLYELMSEDHVFINSDGFVHEPTPAMASSDWKTCGRCPLPGKPLYAEIKSANGASTLMWSPSARSWPANPNNKNY